MSEVHEFNGVDAALTRLALRDKRLGTPDGGRNLFLREAGQAASLEESLKEQFVPQIV